jgi:hypothetical protein
MRLKSFSLHFIIFLAILLTACESNNSFRTEAGVRDQLQGSWKLVPIPRNSGDETWKFDNGKLTITMYRTSPVSTVEGTYKVYTTITTPYIITDGVPLTGKWVVITLNDKILSMDLKTQGTNAFAQREFTKI